MAAQPVSVRHRAAQPVCVRQRAAQPVSVRHRAAQPVSVRPRAAQPVSVRHKAAQPVSVRHKAAQSDSVRHRLHSLLASDIGLHSPSVSDIGLHCLSVSDRAAQPVSVRHRAAQPVSVTQGWALHAPAYNSSNNSGDCFQNSLTGRNTLKHTCLSSGVVPALWHWPCENVTHWEFTAVPVAAGHSDNSNTVKNDAKGAEDALDTSNITHQQGHFLTGGDVWHVYL